VVVPRRRNAPWHDRAHRRDGALDRSAGQKSHRNLGQLGVPDQAVRRFVRGALLAGDRVGREERFVHVQEALAFHVPRDGHRPSKRPSTLDGVASCVIVAW
jgi:hypothetical protein